MKLTLTFRHIDDVDSKFEEVAQEKVSRLERFFDRVHSAELVLSKQGERIKCELIISAVRGQMFIAEVEETKLPNVLDLVVEKMERQMKKFNERTKEKNRRSAIRSGRLIAEMMEAKTASSFTNEEEETEETFEDYIEKYGFESKTDK